MTTQIQSELKFPVTGGPSKFDLMLSLFDGNQTPRKTVEFKLEGIKTPVRVAVTGVSQEDGSGESWIIEGWLSGMEKSFPISLWFTTSSRKGYITFKPHEHRVWYAESGTFCDVIDDLDELRKFVRGLKT